MFGALDAAPVELTLYTDALAIRGTVSTNLRRVTDILNRTDEPFLVLDGVTIEEHALRGQPTRLPFAQVNLDAILFATADLPLEPNTTMRTVKAERRAVVSVPPFSVAGSVHLVIGEGDLRDGLRALVDRFIPVTDATYWSEQLNVAKREAVLVAVNHRRAQYLAPHIEVDPWAGLELRPAVESAAGATAEAGVGTGAETEAPVLPTDGS
jgi:hypothetical protein